MSCQIKVVFSIVTGARNIAVKRFKLCFKNTVFGAR